MKIYIHCLLICCVVIFITSPVTALMIPLSTEELTDQSELVIRVTVEDIQGKWSKKKDVIVTQVSIIIDKIYKGTLDEEKVIVEFDGGEVDGVGFGVSDTAQFTKGEEVLVFLKSGLSKVDGFVYNLIGAAQGKYIIDEEGIAKKEGFSVFIAKEEDKTLIDNNISVDTLIKKISGDDGHAFIWIDRSKKDKEKGINK